MKQKYPWFIAVSALLVAGALVSCESDASFGSQEVEVVPGPSNPEGDPDDSSSSSSLIGCLVEYSGESQCTEMTEAQCQEVISQAAAMGVTVTMQNNCD